MSSIQDLIAQRKALDAAIAASKQQAVEQVRALMDALGVTPADMGFTPPAKAAPSTPTKRPIRYRDDQGNTWTGVGQRPRWLRARLASGADLSAFIVKE